MTTVHHDGITYEVDVTHCAMDSNESSSWIEVEYTIESIKPQDGFGQFDLNDVAKESVLNEHVIEAHKQEMEG